MASRAVICLGNRYMPGDDLGCRVFDCLAGHPAARAADLDIIDGGLAGLDLLGLLEGRQRVVFVDALVGIASAGEVAVLAGAQVVTYASHYGHGAGLPYLLHMLPHVCAAPLPEIALVGAEGAVDAAGVRALARRSLELVRHGLA
jgi:hydrogenase maturation protease